MPTEEQKFYIHKSAHLSKKIIFLLACFALFFIYTQIGLDTLSIVLSAIILLFGSIVIYPLLTPNKPFYIVNDTGIRQNKLFLPRQIRWQEVTLISYPSSPLMGGKDAVTLKMNAGYFVIGLSEVDRPFELLRSLMNYAPYDLSEYDAKLYFEKSFDREKIFYITLLYLISGLSLVIVAVVDAPYVWTEDNKYSQFWMLLFFAHFLFTIGISFSAYKNFTKRKLLVKSALIFWLFVFIGPFLIENNAYYNLRAMKALESKDYITAEQYIRKAIDIHPDGYTYHETLGKTLYGLRKYDESIDRFKFLLENDKRLTNYYIAYYHLWIGKSLVKQKRIDKAKNEFEMVKEHNNEFNSEIEELLNGTVNE